MGGKIDVTEALKSCVDYYDKGHYEYFNKFSDELIKKPYDEQFLQRFLNLLPGGGHILDVGCCSTAQQARYFYQNGFKVTAIDLSEKCVETARKHFPHIVFKQMDMTNMNFGDASFDGINAFYSIIHIPDEKLDVLFFDCNRLLNDGGLFAVTVHAGDFYGYFKENGIPVFYRTYSQEDLEGYLEKYGFEIVEINQRKPIYDFEFQSERIYLIARKMKTVVV